MTTAGSWSVKGIDPKAREIARDLARRSGLSLGEWLNQMITDTGDEPSSAPPPPKEPEPEAAADAPGKADPTRRPAPRPTLTAAPSGGSVLNAESFRSRLREARGGPDAGEVARITQALAEFTGRLEAAELRSTLAISGIDKQALGVLSRLDGVERGQSAVAARLEGSLDEVREAQAHVAERLKLMEGEVGPRLDAMKALESALGRVAAQIHEGECRARAQAVEIREGVSSLGRRVGRIEAKPVPDLSPVDAALRRLAERVDRIESAPPPGPDTAATDASFARLVDLVEDGGRRTSASVRALETAFAGLDQRIGRVEAGSQTPAPDTSAIDAALARLAERMDEAQARTGSAVRALEASFAGLDQRMHRAETGGTEADGPEFEEGGSRLERLASELNEKVESAHAEMSTRLRDAADGQLDRMEAAVRDLSDQVAATERRSAEAIDRMGREVVRIAQGLDGRVGEVERRSDERSAQLGGEMARIADAVENRLSHADGAQAQALEKLGGEIAKIAEKLADRIAASERRNALDLTHGLDEVSEQLQRATDKLNTRYESAAGDLSDRIRQSEERTAKLLAEARERVEAAPRRAVAAEPPELGPDPRFSPDRSAEPDASTGRHEPAFSAQAFDAVHEDDLDPFGGFGVDEAHPPQAVTASEDPFAAAAGAFRADDVHADDGYRQEAAAVPAPPPAAPPRPGSTRELIEQARAAARASAERNRRPSRSGRGPAGADEIFATPAPGFEAAGFETEEPPTLRSRFSLPKLGRRENTTVKTALYASGTAAFLSVAAVGAVTMMGAPHGRAPIEAPTAAPPLATALAPAGAPPILAMAETAPSPAFSSAPDVLKPSAPAPTSAADAASGRTLYNEAVRELERGDRGAVDVLRRAANLGYAPAQFHLGKLYEDGSNGVGRDLAQARRWTERAARAGDPKAMFNYGLFLANGEGAAHNDRAAVDWFRRAADSGVKDAQFNLAVMTQQGRGAAPNAAEAYKWYLIAAADGDMGARQGAEALKPSLSSDAQAAAERSATAYRAQLAAASAQVRTASN